MPVNPNDLEGLDPVVVAAMMDDDDDEEGKEITKAATDRGEETEEVEIPTTDDEEEDDKKTPPAKPANKTEDDDEEELDDADKPPEARDANDDDEEVTHETEEEKLTRRERRAQRNAEWNAKLANRPAEDPAAQLYRTDPNYKPLDYNEDKEVTPEQLAEDRKTFGAEAFRKGAEIERFRATQVNFWDRVDLQNKALLKDQRFAFLDESNKDAFNEKRAAAIGESYLKTIGYKETLVRGGDGNPIYDEKTRKPKFTVTVARTDIPYDEFVEHYMEDLEEYANERDSTATKGIKVQRSRQGIRPGGGRGKSRRVLKPGDISQLSDEEFEELDKNGDIDRAIANAANWT